MAYNGNMKHYVLLLIFTLILVGCGRAETSAVSPDLLEGSTAIIAVESRLLDRGSGKLVEGDRAPDFSFTLPDGTTQRLSDLQGRPVVLNFWASWCLPCIEEMPAIEQVYLAAEGDLVVLAVNRNELPDAIARFANTVEVSFPLIADVTGTIGTRYSITSLPVTYFINRDGTIRARHIGALSETMLAERIQTLE